MSNFLRKLSVAFIALALFVGMKLWNRSESHDEIKDHLLSMCAEDSNCSNAVEQNFDLCFEQSYSIGGRRRSGSLNQDKFLNCFNLKAGKPYFVVVGE